MENEKKTSVKNQSVVDAMVLEIVGSFDFPTVRKVMELLNWRWYPKSDTPSVLDLIKMSERLLHQAYDEWSKDGLFTDCGNGGLYAQCDEEGDLTLRFVVREARVFRKAHEGKETNV